MRALSYILIVFGIYLLGRAVYQEYSGRTFKPAALLLKATGREANRGFLYSRPVLRNQNPELFRQFMWKHWIYAVVVETGGWFLYLRFKRDDDL